MAKIGVIEAPGIELEAAKAQLLEAAESCESAGRSASHEAVQIRATIPPTPKGDLAQQHHFRVHKAVIQEAGYYQDRAGSLFQIGTRCRNLADAVGELQKTVARALRVPDASPLQSLLEELSEGLR